MTNPPQQGPFNPQEPGTPPGGHGQFPGGYPPGYGPTGYGPTPPKKSKTGLWVGGGIAAIAVIVLLITGFVAPGFFLSDDKDSAAAPTNPSVIQPSGNSPSNQPQQPPAATCQPTNQTSPPVKTGNINPDTEKVLTDIVDKINTCDSEGAKALLCPETDLDAQAIDKAIAKNAHLSIEEIAAAVGDGAAVIARNTTEGDVKSFKLGARIPAGAKACVMLFVVN